MLVAQQGFQYDTPPQPNGGSAYGGGYIQSGEGFNLNYNSFRRINGLEVLVVVVMLLTLIGVYSWGLLAANTRARDLQRQAHISQVLNALDQYYRNSSLEPSRRAYPIAVCSTSLNEVDYELTLRQHLTGQRAEFGTHAYITQDEFPRDPWGEYDVNFNERSVAFRCPGILPSGQDTNQYADEYPSCNFSSTRNLNECYIYASSNNGDSFQLGYWSEVARRFVVYSRFRENPIQVQNG